MGESVEVKVGKIEVGLQATQKGLDSIATRMEGLAHNMAQLPGILCDDVKKIVRSEIQTEMRDVKQGYQRAIRNHRRKCLEKKRNDILERARENEKKPIQATPNNSGYQRNIAYPTHSSDTARVPFLDSFSRIQQIVLLVMVCAAIIAGAIFQFFGITPPGDPLRPPKMPANVAPVGRNPGTLLGNTGNP